MFPGKSLSSLTLLKQIYLPRILQKRTGQLVHQGKWKHDNEKPTTKHLQQGLLIWIDVIVRKKGLAEEVHSLDN